MKNDLLKENDLDNFLKEYEELCKKHGICLVSEGEEVHADPIKNCLPDGWDSKGIKCSTIGRDGLVGIPMGYWDGKYPIRTEIKEPKEIDMKAFVEQQKSCLLKMAAFVKNKKKKLENNEK